MKTQNNIKQVLGLSWTQEGGALIPIKVTVTKGNGTLTYTGKVGNAMHESIQVAVRWLKEHSMEIGVPSTYCQDTDIALHLPEALGATEGPSAGLAILIALVSGLLDYTIPTNIAITGEITPQGAILPVGGIKEKLLCAHRCNIETVIIPRGNIVDLQEIPTEISDRMTILPLETVLDAINYNKNEK